MLRHVVMFQWREHARREDVEQFLSGLHLLLSRDEEVRGYRFGTDIGADNSNFDFVLVADFDDLDGYLRYENTPRHDEFVARQVKFVVANRTAVQHAWEGSDVTDAEAPAIDSRSSRLHHVGATVTDLAQATAFYTGVLGAQVIHPVDPGDDPRIRRLVGVPDAEISGVLLETSGGARIELLQYASAHARRLDSRPCDSPILHLAFAVGDLLATLERVRENGGSVLGERVELDDSKFAYCADPDGNILEFIQKS